MDALFENFTMSILRLNKLVHKIKLYEMRDFGLQAIHVMCVYCLAHCGDGMTSVELARQTLEDKAAISRAVASLSDKGYVTVEGGKHRATIRLTDEGRAVAAFIDEKAARAVGAGMDGSLTDERRREFYATLACINDNLEKYYNQLLEERKKADKESKQ